MTREAAHQLLDLLWDLGLAAAVCAAFVVAGLSLGVAGCALAGLAR
jgi:hypothetical protein